MKTLVRLGGQWYTRDGFTLTPTEAPATEPEEFIDGDAIAAELDGLNFDSMANRVGEYVSAYEAARIAAQNGGTELLSNAIEAQAPAVVAVYLRDQRSAELSALTEAPEAATPPNPPVEGEEGEPEAEAVEEGAEEDEDAPEEFVVPDDLSELTEDDVATVSAAARILIRERGGDPAQALAALLPGSTLKSGGVQASAPVAEFRAASNKSVQAGALMDDEQVATEMQRWARAAKGGRSAAAETIGTFELYGPDPTVIAGADKGGRVEAGSEFDVRRGLFRKMESVQRPRDVVTAAPGRCGPADVRREVPDCGDMSSPLLDALQSYPAPHCELEYYRDVSIATVSDGITIWDDAARDDYQDARDAWIAEVAAGAPFSAQLFADLKAAEKGCATAGCPPTDTVTMLPIAACLEYPTDLEYCSPQSIASYRRALNRLFLRERTSNMLAVIETFGANVTVDAAVAPFVNDDTTPIQLGASAVVDIVLSTLKPQGVMAERVTEGNYTVVIPYGLQVALELDGRLAEGMNELSSIFGGSNVITTLDTATGTALPFGSVPAPGSTTAFTALRLPNDWDIHLLDLDDFFEISRPDIELGAQITPESIKGNMVFGGFMESSAGYGKDGCHPSWNISLSNLVYNGARPDRMNLGDLLSP